MQVWDVGVCTGGCRVVGDFRPFRAERRAKSEATKRQHDSIVMSQQPSVGLSRSSLRWAWDPPLVRYDVALEQAPRTMHGFQ